MGRLKCRCEAHTVLLDQNFLCWKYFPWSSHSFCCCCCCVWLYEWFRICIIWNCKRCFETTTTAIYAHKFTQTNFCAVHSRETMLQIKLGEMNHRYIDREKKYVQIVCRQNFENKYREQIWLSAYLIANLNTVIKILYFWLRCFTVFTVRSHTNIQRMPTSPKPYTATSMRQHCYVSEYSVGCERCETSQPNIQYFQYYIEIIHQISEKYLVYQIYSLN